MSNYGKEPAYPALHSLTDSCAFANGVSKLEHFAGLAMQKIMEERLIYPEAWSNVQDVFKEVAKISFDVSQAMCDEAERRSK